MIITIICVQSIHGDAVSISLDYKIMLPFKQSLFATEGRFKLHLLLGPKTVSGTMYATLHIDPALYSFGLNGLGFTLAVHGELGLSLLLYSRSVALK